jgi:hypothetical protein
MISRDTAPLHIVRYFPEDQRDWRTGFLLHFKLLHHLTNGWEREKSIRLVFWVKKMWDILKSFPKQHSLQQRKREDHRLRSVRLLGCERC